MVRYPFFNPYSEQYEIALTRADSISVAQGTGVIAERAVVDSAPSLSIRRLYAGEVPEPLTTDDAFWLVMALAPIPVIALGFRRKPRVRRAPSAPERLLRHEAEVSGADPAVVRRIFAAEVAARVQIPPSAMSDRALFVRLLRRAGVSGETARDAERLLHDLDEAVFGPERMPVERATERAVSILRAVEDEARSRASIAARAPVRAGAGLVLLLTGGALAAWAASQDVAAGVFADGVSAYDAREFGSARQSFFELAQARPRAAAAWFNFGTASWQLHDTAAAVVGWQRAMRLEPIADVAAAVAMPGGRRSSTACRRVVSPCRAGGGAPACLAQGGAGAGWRAVAWPPAWSPSSWRWPAWRSGTFSRAGRRGWCSPPAGCAPCRCWAPTPALKRRAEKSCACSAIRGPGRTWNWPTAGAGGSKAGGCSGSALSS